MSRITNLEFKTSDIIAPPPLFSPEVIAFAKSIADLPKSPSLSLMPKALVVGTTPLGGKHSSDVDFEIYGVEPSTLKAHIEEQCNRNELSLVSFGGNAYLFAIVIDRAGIKYDISLPVTEHGTVERYGKAGIVADPTLSFDVAASRRDFTFTAIGVDPLKGEILDPFNGQQDFKQKLLRAVNIETAGRDPLMTLRALRFIALYGFSVDLQTEQALRKSLSQSEILSTDNARFDRLKYEFTRLFSADGDPATALLFGANIGVFDHLFPTVGSIVHNAQCWSSLIESTRGITQRYEFAGRESPERKASHLANIARHFLRLPQASLSIETIQPFLSTISHDDNDIKCAVALLETSSNTK